ncbi:MAG: transcriptional repressor [Limnochordaceae bacterium]|nr:transcriptional repressor [Limnochordaceae bacterium]
MEKIQGFIRKTKQREVILRVLRGTKSHPTADWVYQEVRKELPNISLGTVYRNLKILTASGEALELSYGSSYSRFDGTPENHYHFVCQRCGRVEDVPMPVDESLDRAVEQLMGVKVRQHRLEFYGLCEQCAAEQIERPERPMALRRQPVEERDQAYAH